MAKAVLFCFSVVFCTAYFALHERYATPHITRICTDGGLWLPSVPERISPSAGHVTGKGHWLVSRSLGHRALEEARRSPGALMGKLCTDLCGKGTLGSHKSVFISFLLFFIGINGLSANWRIGMVPFAEKGTRPTGDFYGLRKCYLIIFLIDFIVFYTCIYSPD